MSPRPQVMRSEGPGLAEPPGICVFIIAAKAIEAGLKGPLLELLEDQGHEVLHSVDLDEAQRAAAAGLVRSLEPPGAAVVAIDLLPMSVEGRYRGFDNPKIPKALERARRLVRALPPEFRGLEPLASTCNSDEAWQAIALLFAGEEARLRAKAERMRGDFATAGAIRDLTREGRRAKVELIEFKGEMAIRKTYRASALSYMEREIEVLERMGPLRPELPRLLSRGANHIILDFVGPGRNLDLEHGGGRPKALPLGVVRHLSGFIRDCIAQGFDPIDIRAPGNVMETSEGLKVIDFELWRRCPPGTRPEDALCLVGVPQGDTGRPRGVPAFSKSYEEAWYPITLLSLESFLHDPAWLQRLKRGANLARSWARRGARALGRRIRPPRGNPRYIPANLGVEGVVLELNRRQVRYVVLRWHEGLPDLPPGGDLDLLVHDDDIAKVDEVLDAAEGTAQCDVYSVSGRPGTAYSNVPHLPPERAIQVLETAAAHAGIYKVPRTAEHFLSLAFHCVYHKGFKTGLPSLLTPPNPFPPPKNDYLGALERLSSELGLELDLTLESLDRFLVSQGWGATPQMLRALRRRNAWVAAQLAEAIS